MVFVLLIIGSRTRVRNFGETLFHACDICHNKGFLKLYCKRVFLTFFFIPLIPISSEYFLTCGNCSKRIRLFGENIKKAKTLNALTQEFIKEELSQEDYLSKIKLTRLSFEMKDRELEFPKAYSSNDNITKIYTKLIYNVKSN